jgi:hypothetical protein
MDVKWKLQPPSPRSIIDQCSSSVSPELLAFAGSRGLPCTFGHARSEQFRERKDSDRESTPRTVAGLRNIALRRSAGCDLHRERAVTRAERSAPSGLERCESCF